MLYCAKLILYSLLALTACAERPCRFQGVSAQRGSLGGVDDSCSADGTCPDADKKVMSEDTQSVPEIPEGVVLELLLDYLQLNSKDGDPKAIFDMARNFSKDPRHTRFAHLTEIDRRLLFIKRVMALMDKREPRKRGGEQEAEKQPEGPWQYPPVCRIKPGQVGDVVEIQLVEGRTHRRITRAVHPPVFGKPTIALILFYIERHKQFGS